MQESDQIVMMTFADPARAFEALAELRQAASAHRVSLHTAAVVRRDADGQLSVRDNADDAAPVVAPVVGGVLGALLGVLAGPLGVLLVGATGVALGSIAGTDAETTRISLIEQMARSVPVGGTALFAEVTETDPAAVDAIAQQLDGHVLRRPTDAVVAEMEQAELAQSEAAERARRTLHERQAAHLHEQYAHWKADFEQRLEAIRQRFAAKG